MDHRNWTSFSEHQAPWAAYPPESEPRRGGLERNLNLVQLARVKFFQSFHATFYTRVCCGTPQQRTSLSPASPVSHCLADEDRRPSKPFCQPRWASTTASSSNCLFCQKEQRYQGDGCHGEAKSNGSVAGLVGMNQYRLYWLVWT